MRWSAYEHIVRLLCHQNDSQIWISRNFQIASPLITTEHFLGLTIVLVLDPMTILYSDASVSPLRRNHLINYKLQVTLMEQSLVTWLAYQLLRKYSSCCVNLRCASASIRHHRPCKGRKPYFAGSMSVANQLDFICILYFEWVPGVLILYADVSEKTVPKRRLITFRRRGITQKKDYNIQNTAKVWNLDFIYWLKHRSKW